VIGTQRSTQPTASYPGFLRP